MTTKINTVEANSIASNGGQYTFVQKIGEGAFGTVFLATDSRNNGRQVAIKIIYGKLTFLEFWQGTNSRRVNEGHQEAQKLFRLKHKNIVEIVRKFDFQGPFERPWSWSAYRGIAIVTQFYAQGSLEQYLSLRCSRYCLPSFLERILLYQQLAVGLAFIHGQKIAHRDLKLANILVDSNNNLKIGDVGLAKAIYDGKNDSGEHQEMTYQNYMSSCNGTKEYMAPEVWRGRYGLTCDVFSLGLVYVMIAECPNPLIPRVRYQNHKYEEGLGWLLQEEEGSRSMRPTELLYPSFRKVRNDEKALFDKMLCHDTRSRKNISEVERELVRIRDAYTAARTPMSLHLPQRRQPFKAKKFWFTCTIIIIVIVSIFIFWLYT